MNAFFRFVICYAISLVAQFLCGYVNLMDDISESVAVTAFFLMALIPATLGTLIWGSYLRTKKLAERLDRLEKSMYGQKTEEE